MLRCGRTLLLALLAALFVGCATDGEQVRSTSWLNWLRRPQTPMGPDVVVLQIALIERPLADAYLNGELWTMTDEMVVPGDRKKALEDNGFRVGQVIGNTPAGLDSLLRSKRSCANPRAKMIHAGDTTPIELGPILALCRFQTPQDGPPTEFVREQAQCRLSVVATLTRDGKTRLQFTPQIQHGPAKLVPWQTGPDQSQWELAQQQPTDSFPAMSWEVALAPNEWIIVGARLDKPQSLGQCCFLREEERPPVQRLLVLRTSRMIPGVAAEPFSDFDESDAKPSKNPPLALQAAFTAVRGSQN